MTEQERIKILVEYRNKPYSRLANSKLPCINLYSQYFERMVKDFESEELGYFMKCLYKYINEGAIYDFKSQRLKNLWDDLLNKINEKADWWFNKKEEKHNKLTISKDDIDSVFRTEGNYVGIIDEK